MQRPPPLSSLFNTVIMMKAMAALFMLLLSCLIQSSSACWKCHPDCDGYAACVQENIDAGRNCRRQLTDDLIGLDETLENARRERDEKLFPVEPFVDYDGPGKTTDNVKRTNVTLVESNHNLRGATSSVFTTSAAGIVTNFDDNQTATDKRRQLQKQRQLQSSSFQLRMEWQPSYCWQEEQIARRYCWECVGSCSNNAKVQIQNCDDGNNRQRWVYRTRPGGYVSISPNSNTDLCVHENGAGPVRLASCRSTNNDAQLFSGFQDTGSRFELTPKRRSNDLISQHHDPKPGEDVEPELALAARRDHTNFWEVINLNGRSVGGGDNNGDNDDGNESRAQKIDDGGNGKDPIINFKGSEFCTPQNKCGLCEGDCDSDKDCEGSLVCKERDAGQSLMGCSGGENDGSRNDYCVPP